MGDLEGRAALITGANRGFGLAIAEAYVDAGADVMLCARDEATLSAVRDSLAARASEGQKVLAGPLDVSSESAAREFVAMTIEALPHLQILVNNAGVYGPKGGIETVSLDEWVRSIEINLFGSVYMCAAIVPHLKSRRYGKIIQLSGGGATNPMPRLSAYAAAKAAVVRFAETLAVELRDDGVDVNAIAPGALNTRLLDEVLEAGPDQVGQAFYDRAIAQKAQGGASMDKGAALAVFLGSKASDGITGKLISAIWDPWAELPDHLDDLRGSDVYGLRRIVPSDRGLDWG
ncbi:MAG: SDR family NAD(P)-dependent oxidoreductase [Ilumatobacteraceae bacterium]